MQPHPVSVIREDAHERFITFSLLFHAQVSHSVNRFRKPKRYKRHFAPSLQNVCKLLLRYHQLTVTETLKFEASSNK